jgi:uncharacterized membrane protein YfcA
VFHQRASEPEIIHIRPSCLRPQQTGSRRWIVLLSAPSLVGGIVGAVLLLHTSSRTFSAIVPYLLLTATLLLAAQEFITRKLRTANIAHEARRGWLIGAILFNSSSAFMGFTSARDGHTNARRVGAARPR